MSNLQGFDANEIEPQGSFDPIPAGWYVGMIVASEMKPTKTGSGEYLQLRIDIIDGEYEGRVLFDRLNLRNSNQTAVDIAQRQLSAICRAVGVMQPQDSSDLHDRPLRVKVSIRPAGNGHDASNEIRGYSPIEGSEKQPAQAARTAPAAAAPAAKPSGRKPWQ